MTKRTPTGIVTRRVRQGYFFRYKGSVYPGGTEVTGPAEELQRLFGSRLEAPVEIPAAAVEAAEKAGQTAEDARRAHLAALSYGDLVATGKAVLRQKVGRWSASKIVEAIVAHERDAGAFSGAVAGDDSEDAAAVEGGGGEAAGADPAEE